MGLLVSFCGRLDLYMMYNRKIKIENYKDGKII